MKRGEIFALLGVNGAGKSSTFNMIVGDENLSGGKATLQGVNIEDVYMRPYLLDGLVGYCPQTNASDPYSTVKATLTLYANLAGIEERKTSRIVQDLMVRFNLIEFADTR